MPSKIYNMYIDHVLAIKFLLYYCMYVTSYKRHDDMTFLTLIHQFQHVSLITLHLISVDNCRYDNISYVLFVLLRYLKEIVTSKSV